MSRRHSIGPFYRASFPVLSHRVHAVHPRVDAGAKLYLPSAAREVFLCLPNRPDFSPFFLHRSTARTDPGGLAGSPFGRGPLRRPVPADVRLPTAASTRVPPLGVARPRGVADVKAAIRYCAENGHSLHARGAGTGLAGEFAGTGAGPRLLAGHAADRECGGRYRQLFQPRGSCWGNSTAICLRSDGGSGPTRPPAASPRWGVFWLSITAAATGSLRFRSSPCREHAGGSCRRRSLGGAARHPVTDDPDFDPHPRRRREIVRRLADLIQREDAVIKANQPRAWVNRAGYHLTDVLKDGQLDLARLSSAARGSCARRAGDAPDGADSQEVRRPGPDVLRPPGSRRPGRHGSRRN